MQVNTDVIINHCATNINMGFNVGCWVMGFDQKVSKYVNFEASTRNSLFLEYYLVIIILTLL
jgi:hypothetical protein